MSENKGKYTKPKMRQAIVDRLMRGGKYGRPGQWSARKAQAAAKEYKRRGGGYRD